MNPEIRIIQGDALEQLKQLPDCSVQCCVTSPPYWGLRDYGVPGQLGLEKTPEEYIAKMVAVFREVRRALRADGTCWVNMGDAYASQGGPIKEGGGINDILGGKPEWQDYNVSRKAPTGLKPKDLCGIPWRLAFALQADGWWLRQDIIWHKPNPMPESVTDRCTKAHEYVFLLSKSARYYFDQEAIKEDTTGNAHNGRSDGELSPRYGKETMSGLNQRAGTWRQTYLPSNRNRRSVWTIPTEPYPGSHFATFPTALVQPCILAGTSAKGCCPKCGAPWERVVEKPQPPNGLRNRSEETKMSFHTRSCGGGQKLQDWYDEHPPSTTGWRPTCKCGETTTQPCTVLDPFGGSGTVGQVALELGRSAVLIELNPKYIELARRRCDVTPGLRMA